MSERTIVHLMRHGEVHNPEGIIMATCPGYRLNEVGRGQSVPPANSWPSAVPSTP